jgi:hypothetical protein
MPLVLRTFWHWLPKKFYSLNRLLERKQRGDAHSQMSGYDAIKDRRPFGTNQMASRLQRDVNDSVTDAEAARHVEVNKGSVGTSYRGNGAGQTWDDFSMDWRLFVGFIGHDGTPHLWNKKENAWTPR